jgi:HAD superfamily hydrolase (TIGR01509 family)
VRSDVAVLFDLDGVIVDSRPQHVAAWERWARDHAPHAPAGYFQRSFGLRNDAIIGGIVDGLAPDDLRRLAERKEELFRAEARGSLVMLPGARELIDFLLAQRVPLAIVTSTPRENLDLVLTALALDGCFQALVAEEDATKGKPNPEGFLVAAARLSVEPGNAVVIEDAPAGVAAAKAAGMRAIGVTTSRPAADLGDADLVVDSLAEEAVRTFIVS